MAPLTFWARTFFIVDCNSSPSMTTLVSANIVKCPPEGQITSGSEPLLKHDLHVSGNVLDSVQILFMVIPYFLSLSSCTSVHSSPLDLFGTAPLPLQSTLNSLQGR